MTTTALDIDHTALRRLLDDEYPRPRTTRAERAAAVVILTERGLTAEQIAQRIDRDVRTVQRLRQEARAGKWPT